MALEISGILAENKKLQYMCTLLRGEALIQFDDFCAQVGSMTLVYLNQFILYNSYSKVRIIQKWKNIVQKLNFVEILCQKVVHV